MRFIKLLKYFFHKIYRNLYTFARWGVLSLAAGLVVGGFSSLFARCLRFVTDFRTSHTFMILFLPLAVSSLSFCIVFFNIKMTKEPTWSCP